MARSRRLVAIFWLVGVTRSQVPHRADPPTPQPSLHKAPVPAPTRADGQIEAKLSEVEQAMGSMNRDMNQRMARLEQMLSQVTGS